LLVQAKRSDAMGYGGDEVKVFAVRCCSIENYQQEHQKDSDEDNQDLVNLKNIIVRARYQFVITFCICSPFY
jgi:hypothetical protein